MQPVGTCTSVRLEQLLKHASPMVVRLAGRTIELNDVQSRNAFCRSVVRPNGSVTEVKDVQPRNVASKIVVTLDGSVMEVNDVQS